MPADQIERFAAGMGLRECAIDIDGTLAAAGEGVERNGAPGSNREDGRDDRADRASGLSCQGAADIDEVVTNDAQTHPSLHSAVSFVATTVQPVASLEHADAAFTAGPPFLPVLEPACFLERCAIFTLT